MEDFVVSTQHSEANTLLERANEILNLSCRLGNTREDLRNLYEELDSIERRKKIIREEILHNCRAHNVIFHDLSYVITSDIFGEDIEKEEDFKRRLETLREILAIDNLDENIIDRISFVIMDGMESDKNLIKDLEELSKDRNIEG